MDPALGARSLGGRWLSVRGSDARGDAPLVQVIVLMVTLVRALSFGELVSDGWLGGRSRLVDGLARLVDPGLVGGGVTLVGMLACLMDTCLVQVIVLIQRVIGGDACACVVVW